LPIDLEDMVYAFEPLPRDVQQLKGAQRTTGDEEPTFVQAQSAPAGGRVAAPTDGTRVLACAMGQDRARAMLDRLSEHGLQPRGLIAVPAAYRRAAERIAACQASKSGGAHTAIIDMGHERTDVCVVIDDRVSYVRSLHRGGKEVTAAIAQAYKLPWDKAEAAKHADGFIASRAKPVESRAWEAIHQCVESVVSPLARELRRTFAACRAKTGATIQRAVIVGGASRINGMPEYLTEQLGIEVTRITAEDSARLLGTKFAPPDPHAYPAWADGACLAAGVTFEGATGRPQFDLRQGSLAYKADLSFLRAKAAQLIWAAVIVIAFAAGSAYASLYKLRAAEKVLDERLAVESRVAFQKEMTAEEVLEEIGPSDSDKDRSPIPEMTAYDLLLALNKTLPERAQVKLDIYEIDIKTDKITLRGESAPTEGADALTGIDKLEQQLKSSSCFKDYTSGETQPGANDTREFSMTIKVACDKQAKPEEAKQDPNVDQKSEKSDNGAASN
jgi:general secretion pathway protein L